MKRINTELLIGKMADFYVMQSQIKIILSWRLPIACQRTVRKLLYNIVWKQVWEWAIQCQLNLEMRLTRM